MSKSEFYLQCILRRKISDGHFSTLTTWIEESKAIEDSEVTLKNNPAYLDKIYTIVQVGKIKRTAQWVSERQKSYERWRAITDV